MSTPLADDIALNQTYAHAFARVLVRPLLGTPVRPNHLTLLRMLIGIAACALLGVGREPYFAWSGVLWVIACVLDRADGELARIGDMRSESGKVLDFYSDMILDAFWFLGAGIGIRHGWLGGTAVMLGTITCISMLLCTGVSEWYERLSPPGVKAFYGLQRFHPDDALFLLALFTWLHWLTPILILASVCTPLIAMILVVRLFALKLKTQRPSLR